MGFYQWVQLGYMGARMETFGFTLTYWCTPSSGTVRFTPECTNVPQPRCTEVPNSSGLRYSVPGTPWFAEVRRAQVQWGEEAFLTPICDPSLHCIIPHIIPHHGTLYSNIDLKYVVLYCISRWNARLHSTVQKIEMFTFPKRKSVIVPPGNLLALVNCQILVQQRYFTQVTFLALAN